MYEKIELAATQGSHFPHYEPELVHINHGNENSKCYFIRYLGYLYLNTIVHRPHRKPSALLAKAGLKEILMFLTGHSYALQRVMQCGSLLF
jgi:hypothetical protein